MREIKFRAWTDEGMMPVTRLTFAGSVVYVYDSETDYEYQCDSNRLMQYTGLKDKNGVEIYEGDIVERTDLRWGGWTVGGLGGDKFYQDVFDLERFIETTHPYEVIGNIYENKELLK